MPMTVMITGGAGMVARNVMEHGRSGQYDILAPRRAELDLLDRNAIRRYIDTHRPDMIVHIAGKVGGIEANRREPSAFLVENLTIGTNIVTAARDSGIRSRSRKR
jgi:GDP-L-fucose synthase